MRKALLILAGCVAACGLLLGLVAATPLGAIFLWVTFQSFVPQTIGWEAKNAWVKCDGAIAGSLSWPPEPGAACAAMDLCANEAKLSSEQYAALVAATRRVPHCGEP